jgi:hypothetical protein
MRSSSAWEIIHSCDAAAAASALVGTDSPKATPLANGELGFAEQLRHLSGRVRFPGRPLLDQLQQRRLDALQPLLDRIQLLGQRSSVGL